MASPAVFWATALLLVGLSAANPSISFPINSQVPPVARIGQPFSFVFSPSTFSSTSPITYSLSGAPRWLSIDSNSRRLFGTPGPDDVPPGRVAGVPLSLVATDNSGSTTHTATLVVSREPGPAVEVPLDKQAFNFGTFSAPSAILSTPGKTFSFRLDPNTFSKPPGVTISYYATMADNTPLLAWISFDPSTLSFSGQTPSAESLVQPPQRFSFQVIASDVVGFAGAALGFDIYVGSHRLVADETVMVLNATRGTPLSYAALRDTIRLDGQPTSPENVSIASTPNIPPWLSVDNHTWEMTGVPPETAESTNFTVTLHDTYGDNLNLTVLIEVAGNESSLFTGEPPKLTIAAGEPFSFDLRPYLSNPQDTEVSVEASESYPWIQFNASTTTLYGNAPQGSEDRAVNVKLHVKSSDSKKSASLSVEVVIRGVSGSPSSTTATPAGHSQTGDSLGTSQFNPLLLAVLLPLLLLLALAICALFWYFRRRNGRRRPPLSTRDISGPLPGSSVSSITPPPTPSPLPDFSKRFGKSFSADDVFGPEKKNYLDSRNAFLTRPDLPQHPGSMRLLPPGGSPPSDPAAVSPETNQPPPVASGAIVTLRPGARGKISSSLSSITETSIGELVDSRGVESAGNDSRQSFRDKIEIHVPKLAHTSGPASATSPSPTEAAWTPRPDSSRTANDPDAMLLRAESRVSYHPPAPAVRKLSWQWLKGVKGRRQGSRLVSGMKRLSEKPSVSTVDDTLVSEKAGEPLPSSPFTNEGNNNNGNETGLLNPPSLPLPEFPSRASFSRPPSRRSSPPTSGNLEPKTVTDNAADRATPDPSLPTGTIERDNSAVPSFPLPGATPAESLNIYDDIAELNPFLPSKTWSTVPTCAATDEWVDETVSSLALSRAASQHQGQHQHQGQQQQESQNWIVLQESPVRERFGVAATGMLSGPGSLGRFGAREAEGEPLRPATAPTGDGQRERSGLTWKSQSKGMSLRSEGTQGSRSDYAVFI